MGDFLRERAAWYEIVVFLLGLVALVLNALGLRQAVDERAERRDSGQNGQLGIIADWSVSNNTGYTAVQACFVLVYIILIAIPPSGRSDVTALRIAAILLFLLAQGILLVTALRSQHFRHRAFNYREGAQAPGTIKVTTQTMIEPVASAATTTATEEGQD